MADQLALYELRLIRCLLSGPLPDEQTQCSNVSLDIMATIANTVKHIELGLYTNVLSLPELLSIASTSLKCTHQKSEKWPADFYEAFEAAMEDFVGRSREHEFLALAAGVAALLAFMQVNVTGPQMLMSSFPFSSVLEVLNLQKLNHQQWDGWANRQMMVDGCDLLGKCELPQYLLLAKILILPGFKLTTLPEDIITNGLPTKLWWIGRAFNAQQRLLAERSPSLCSVLSKGFLEILKWFGTPEAVKSSTWQDYIYPGEEFVISASICLEIGLIESYYGHVDAANDFFRRAEEICGLKLSVTGVLGYRTRYQVDPKAQMVLTTGARNVAGSILDMDGIVFGEERKRNISDESGESDILLAPKLVGEKQDMDQSVPHLPVLSTIEQALALAKCVNIKRSSPDDELRTWEMAPYIEAVDKQSQCHHMIKACCDLLRIRWERTRSRTRERSLLMMESLVNELQRGSGVGSMEATRMAYVFCVSFSTLQTISKEYAETMISFGVIGEAMKIFEDLELWDNLIDCYKLLGKKAVAAELIRHRLEVAPSDPRLWCSLGDVTLEDKYYVTAWEVSNSHFARAQRSLARSTYNRGDFQKSVEHWDAALALNPLHPDGWFALGSAALKSKQFDKALNAFTRSIQLDPENGESWNNIAALNMHKKRSKEAFVAFREALKFKRGSWHIWKNFAEVSLDVENYGQSFLAVEKVYELSQGKEVDLVSLSRLLDAIENKHGIDDVPESQCKFEDTSADSSTNTTVSIDRPDGVATCKDMQGLNRTALIERIGNFLKLVSDNADSGPAIWGLKAQWHRVVGDIPSCLEALLKQVRSFQGWQHDKGKFKDFATASLDMCSAYMSLGTTRSCKKNLLSAQMHLRNTIKQSQDFEDTEEYKALNDLLEKVKFKIQEL